LIDGLAEKNKILDIVTKMRGVKVGYLITEESEKEDLKLYRNVVGFVDFDKNSFALRLSYPDELSKLHKEIAAVARKYAQTTSTNAEETYFRENYRPHITISESSSQFDRNSQVLIGRNFIVPEYFLAGKYAGNWEHVQRFGAG